MEIEVPLFIQGLREIISYVENTESTMENFLGFFDLGGDDLDLDVEILDQISKIRRHPIKLYSIFPDISNVICDKEFPTNTRQLTTVKVYMQLILAVFKKFKLREILHLDFHIINLLLNGLFRTYRNIWVGYENSVGIRNSF